MRACWRISASAPSDIDRVAAQSVGGKGEWIALSLLRHAGRRIADWANKRATYRSLMSLDDRMLTDIGLTRGDIPALVEALRGPLARPASSFESEVVMPLKQWNLWRTAHKQLSQLDNRMLNDIGLVRGDIDGIADELAARSVAKAANANTAAPTRPPDPPPADPPPANLRQRAIRAGLGAALAAAPFPPRAPLRFRVPLFPRRFPLPP